MTATTYTYTDPTSYAGTFTGRIQIDRSGVGHNWQTVAPEDMHNLVQVMVALAEANGPDGDIEDGAEANVGGMNYRALAD